MKEFDQAACQALREDVMEALKEVGEKHGINLSFGRGNYNKHNFIFKIEASVVADGRVLTREADVFKRRAFEHGFVPDDLFKTIPLNGSHYMIVGLNPRRRKFPVLVQRLVNGAPVGDQVVLSVRGCRQILNQTYPDHRRSV